MSKKQIAKIFETLRDEHKQDITFFFRADLESGIVTINPMRSFYIENAIVSIKEELMINIAYVARLEGMSVEWINATTFKLNEI